MNTSTLLLLNAIRMQMKALEPVGKAVHLTDCGEGLPPHSLLLWVQPVHGIVRKEGMHLGQLGRS